MSVVISHTIESQPSQADRTFSEIGKLPSAEVAEEDQIQVGILVLSGIIHGSNILMILLGCPMTVNDTLWGKYSIGVTILKVYLAYEPRTPLGVGHRFARSFVIVYEFMKPKCVSFAVFSYGLKRAAPFT